MPFWFAIERYCLGKMTMTAVGLLHNVQRMNAKCKAQILDFCDVFIPKWFFVYFGAASNHNVSENVTVTIGVVLQQRSKKHVNKMALFHQFAIKD